jgi:hypothetical protein
MKIKITLADRIATALNDFDERVDRNDPEFLVYQGLHDRMDRQRRVVLTTPAEVRVILDELESGIDVCDEAMGYLESDEEQREYTMERGTLQRSFDRLQSLLKQETG